MAHRISKKTIGNQKREQGFLSLNALFVLVFFLSIVFVSLRLAPLYIENTYVKSALKSLLRHPDGTAILNQRNVRLLLEKQFLVNGVNAEILSTLQVVREDDNAVIALKYERRVPLLFNVEAVLSFANMVDSRDPEACCDWKDIGNTTVSQLH